ncbi:hypothetical protein SMY00_003818 [Cronobacter sakazakii]|uniref:hypothetical protein n=1 Tax=Cronobacter sakazakii TaxID=28141 RepID=UPI000B3E247F|nr:hypothetical protein [Cronobacter sakazakii]ELY2519259.1 hypothetical protein [Cronobacter sakazakii]ELY2747177.1 hypothetical protein [Cronobacter sakazakii]ELY3705422.1 hypothetical protein [Cronobacter sakazakii]ELY3799231.1 hypothetical protein [Cronobacter sakazakii]ELY3813830.1 hypothetical protein [Cronobacter sakazakii]
MSDEEEQYLDDYGLRRKKFEYDHRIHHGYIFAAGQEVYIVIIASLVDERTFTKIGYELPEGVAFPPNGMAEVYFDVYDGMGNLNDFRHVSFDSLGSAVVLQKVSLALIAHYEKFDVGGFVFQAAAGGVADVGRRVSLEETYDYLLGLKSEPRYNERTGMYKKAPRSLLPEDLRAYKTVIAGRANYAVL